MLPAPMSPDFGSWVPKDTWAWFRRHAPLAPARACELRVGRRGRCVFHSRRSFGFPDLGGPLRYCRGQHRSLAWTLCPDQSRRLEPLSPFSTSQLPVRLAPSLPPDVSALLSHRFRIRPIGASPSRFPRGHPKVSLSLPVRVRLWLCSGFPRRHRLLTVMKLSLNRAGGKAQTGHFAC